MARIVVDAERHIKETEYTDRRKQRRATFPSPRPSARPRRTPPTTWICAASRSSPSRDRPPASSRSTTPRRPSSPSAPSRSPSTASTCCGAPRPIRCPKINSTEALVECAESLLEQGGYVKPREVIAIVAGTRTKSGSTNFLRLHVMGENNRTARASLLPTKRSRFRRLSPRHPKRRKLNRWAGKPKAKRAGRKRK